MKGVRISRFIFSVLVAAIILFAARTGIDLLIGDKPEYADIAAWCILMGLFYTITLRPGIKWMRKIMVAMHGEEKVKAYEDDAALRDF